MKKKSVPVTFADLKSGWPKQAYVIHRGRVVKVGSAGKTMKKNSCSFKVVFPKGVETDPVRDNVAAASRVFLKYEYAKQALLGELDLRVQNVLETMNGLKVELYELLIEIGRVDEAGKV